MQYIFTVLLWLPLLLHVASLMGKLSCALEKRFYLHSSIVNHDLEVVPFDDIIPFLSEHIQPSDQILFLGNNFYLR